MLPFRTLQFLLVILLFAFSSFAQAIKVTETATTEVEARALGGVVTVTAPTVLTSNGSNIVVNIDASDMTGQGVFGFDGRIQFAPGVIDPIAPNFGCSTAGTLFAGAGVTCNLFPTPNVITFSVSGLLVPAAGSGTILKLNFNVSGAAGTNSPLAFQSFVFGEGDPMSTLIDGSVTVLTPTAAGTSVSGMVMSQSGDAIGGVRITLMNQAGEVRTAISNPFGFYRFDDIPVGQIYILSATSKRYTFAPQTISVFDEIANLNLVAEQ